MGRARVFVVKLRIVRWRGAGRRGALRAAQHERVGVVGQAEGWRRCDPVPRRIRARRCGGWVVRRERDRYASTGSRRAAPARGRCRAT